MKPILLSDQEIKAILRFKELFYTSESEEIFAEEDWNSMAIGFMVASNISTERAFELSTKISDLLKTLEPSH